jgi:CxxC motif-containing protein (DUF1111 family)
VNQGSGLFLSVSLLLSASVSVIGQTVVDPGVRPGSLGAGGLVAGLTSDQVSELPDFAAAFNRVNTVIVTAGVRGGGLGPRFNSNSCASCHAQPVTGGASPASNPLYSVYQLNGATNTMPVFITANGPALNARFPFQSDLITPDGQIKPLFTITGRSDAGTCKIAQPDFVTAATQKNLVFRQPIPLFGDAYIDQILDTDILANQNSNTTWKQTLGISGHPNINPADGNIKKFGWKAQVKSLKAMATLEQQVQKGVTTQFFPNELDETAGCVLNGVPEDSSNHNITIKTVPGRDAFTGDAQRAAIWLRFQDQPTPATPLNTTNGQTQFNAIGCGLCHTQSFVTPASTILNNNVTANLFSDLLVHHMGACLADNIVQGTAQGDEFRTAPLWGVGQRVFFLHDGRTTDIVQAIEQHFCLSNGNYGPSEANAVINAFNALAAGDQQDLVFFLRNL